MYATVEPKMSLCVLMVFVINLINQLECRKTGLMHELNAATGYPNSNSNQNLRKTDATVADATQPLNLQLNPQLNQQTPNDDQLRALEQKLAALSPADRQATVNSLNRYFLVYNLLKTKPLKRTLHPPAARLSSHSSFSSSFQPSSSVSGPALNGPASSSFFRPASAKRKVDFTRLAFTPGFMAKKAANSRQENRLNQQSSNMSAYLNIVHDWKKAQPTCSQLKNLWETAISKLSDHFLNENNDLYMQPHLNQMDNPIYLALLINLLRNEQEPLKVFSFKEPLKAGLNLANEKASSNPSSPNSIVNHSKNDRQNDRQNGKPNDKQNDELSKAEQSKPLPMDYLMKMLNLNKPKESEPYYFKNFKLLDKESAAKFIPNPIDRQDHSLEIIEDGPTFIYNVDSDSNPAQFSAAQFWGDAQLSKPVNKPEARY